MPDATQAPTNESGERFPQRFSRRKVWITAEGWYFLFVVAFIVVGSIFPQINLLLIVSGLMVASIPFSWRIAVTMVRWLDATRSFPDWVFARQVFVVEWRVVNHRRYLNSWSLNITDRIAPENGGKESQATVNIVVPQVNVRSTAYASFRCLLDRRGVYEFGPARISCRFPLGLVRAWIDELRTQRLVVLPRVGRLTQAWERRIRSILTGNRQQHRRRGIAQDEFFALRPWQSGDSTRWIHWRSTAKHRELTVKQFEDLSEQEFAILLDLWVDNPSDPVQVAAVETVLSCATTVLLRFRSQARGTATVLVCGEQNFVFNDRIAHESMVETFQQLAVARGSSAPDLESALAQLDSTRRGSSPIIALSSRSLQDAVGAADGNLQSDSTSSPLANGIRHWINVNDEDFAEMFHLNADAGVEAILDGATETEPDPDATLLKI